MNSLLDRATFPGKIGGEFGFITKWDTCRNVIGSEEETCHVSRLEWWSVLARSQSGGQLARAEKVLGWHAVARDPRKEGLGRALTDAWKERAL
ncbi:hypothetical protein L484_012006 [Morus notabilis]|uniref:Uncharacterized protein n=1 Tax=Morus notabilis TaxID=981085 RepID=W9RM21_9ROSA|nr:hypothetical protein L484_012006 [Morus notabilis]